MTNTHMMEACEAELVRMEGGTVLRYLAHVTSKLGVALFTLTGHYPPSNDQNWAINEQVEEMLFVISGRGNFLFRAAHALPLTGDCAIHIPAGRRGNE